MAKLMYDSTNQYSNEKIGQLTDRKVHARHLMTKNYWNDQAEHRWFTVSSLLNKSAPSSSNAYELFCTHHHLQDLFVWPLWCLCHHLTQSLQQCFAQKNHRPKHRQNPEHQTSIEPKTATCKTYFQLFLIIILQWWLKNKMEIVCGYLCMCGGRRVITHNALLSS